MPIPNPIKVTPNVDRCLVKLLSAKHLFSEETNILVPGQLKAGENLLYGEVIDGGSTKFKSGTKVYYSEYSAAALFRLGEVAAGVLSIGEAMNEENKLYVIAEDDIMAYEETGKQFESKTKIISRSELGKELFKKN